MRVTLRIEGLVGRSRGPRTGVWLWPVFFALDDRALGDLLSRGTLADELVHRHPPIAVDAGTNMRSLARPALGIRVAHTFDLHTDLLGEGHPLVGLAVLVEEGERPSKRAGASYDDLVDRLRVRLARRIGATTGFSGLTDLLEGAAPISGDAPPRVGAELLGGGGLPTREDDGFDRLRDGPLLPMLEQTVSDDVRTRSRDLLTFVRLSDDPEFDEREAMSGRPMVRGLEPGEIGRRRPPEAPTGSRAGVPSDRPNVPPIGGTRGAGGGRLGGSRIGLDVGLSSRVSDALLRARPPIAIPTPHATQPAVPRLSAQIDPGRPLPMPDRFGSGEGVIASSLLFWRLEALTAEGGIAFQSRLHGERGARASFRIRGRVQVSNRAVSRPVGWSVADGAGATVVSPTDDGGLKTLFRGLGAATRASLEIRPGRQPAGRISGDGTEAVARLAWRAFDGSVIVAHRKAVRAPWTLRDATATAHGPGAAGTPAIAVSPSGERAIVAYGGAEGGIHVLDGRGATRWTHRTVTADASGVVQIGLGPVGNDDRFWMAWRGDDGTPHAAVEVQDGAWKVMPVRARGDLPPMLQSPLALTDGARRVPILAYRGSDGLAVLTSRGRGWHVERAPLQTAPAPIGDVAGAVVPELESVAFAYRGREGGLHLLLRDDRARWMHERLETAARAPRGGTDPSVWCSPGGYVHVTWADADGRVWEAHRSPKGEWRSADLDAIADLGLAAEDDR